MNSVLHYGNPVYLLLSFIIMIVATYTTACILQPMNQKKVRLIKSKSLIASLIFSLGLWTMDAICFLSSEHVFVVDWNTVKVFMVSTTLLFFALWLLHPRERNAKLFELLALILIIMGIFLLHYLPILFSSTDQYTLNLPLFLISILIGLVGGYLSIIMNRHNSRYNKWMASIICSVTIMTMLQMSKHVIQLNYTEELTADRLEEHLLLVGVILGVTSFLIILFSLITWYSLRKIALMDERYKALVENSTDTIALIHQGNWEYMNQSGLKMFEVSHEDQIIDTSIYDWLQEKEHKDMRSWLECPYIIDQDESPMIELEWVTRSAEVLKTEVVRVRTSFSGQSYVQVIIRDISERKKNEAQYVTHEKLAIAGQLAAGIAHEIRNPLTTLKGFMQLVATEDIHNKRYYAIMESELLMIESIISELLMLSKPQVTEFKKVDTLRLLEQAVHAMQIEADLRQIEIVKEIRLEKSCVLGVFVQLKQVFINVLENALESMPSGGKVTVSLYRDHHNYICIEIQDEGIGMSAERLANLGQPFYTTKEKGTGLGLMVSYKIIENHNGQIISESKLGEGSVMTIRIPQYKGE